jgi:hypothetical protein
VEKLQAVLGEHPALKAIMEEIAGLFRPVLVLDGTDQAFTEPGINLTGPFTVETWVRLAPGIDNNDGILGAPGVLDLNFYDGKFRVWIGDKNADAVVARRPMTAGIWTHLAVTRDAEHRLTIYIDGMPDSTSETAVPQAFENLRIGWSQQAKGTAGALSEFRVWNRARTEHEILTTFDRGFAADHGEPNLVFRAAGDGPWGKLQRGATVVKVSDYPPLLTADEAVALDAQFAKYRTLAAQPGDLARGKAAAALCFMCHLIEGEGKNIGPNLSGVGAWARKRFCGT